jgi:hypothetical protein
MLLLRTKQSRGKLSLHFIGSLEAETEEEAHADPPPPKKKKKKNLYILYSEAEKLSRR